MADDDFDIDIYGDTNLESDETFKKDEEGDVKIEDVEQAKDETAETNGHSIEESAVPELEPGVEVEDYVDIKVDNVTSNNPMEGQQQIKSTDESGQDALTIPKQAPQQQGVKRKEGSDDRIVDAGATTAILISELHWWNTDDDVRGWVNQAQCEDELKEITFSEHKVNGKSKGQAYVEFTSQQAATAAKQKIASFGEGQQYVKKHVVTYSNPNINPFRTLPKDAPTRAGKEGQTSRGGASGYNDRNGQNAGNYNNNFRGRTPGYNSNRGNMNNMGGSFNRNFSGNSMGAMGGGFQAPVGNNFQNGMANQFGGFNNRGGGMMNNNMRGNAGNMRGGRGGGMLPGMMGNMMGNMSMGMGNMPTAMASMGNMQNMTQMGAGMPGTMTSYSCKAGGGSSISSHAPSRGMTLSNPPSIPLSAAVPPGSFQPSLTGNQLPHPSLPPRPISHGHPSGARCHSMLQNETKAQRQHIGPGFPAMQPHFNPAFYPQNQAAGGGEWQNPHGAKRPRGE